MTNALQFVFKIDSRLICFAVLSLHENFRFSSRFLKFEGFSVVSL